jgi:hypothetical protein
MMKEKEDKHFVDGSYVIDIVNLLIEGNLKVT